MVEFNRELSLVLIGVSWFSSWLLGALHIPFVVLMRLLHTRTRLAFAERYANLDHARQQKVYGHLVKAVLYFVLLPGSVAILAAGLYEDHRYVPRSDVIPYLVMVGYALLIANYTFALLWPHETNVWVVGIVLRRVRDRCACACEWLTGFFFLFSLSGPC
jgi:hypothetical protein